MTTTAPPMSPPLHAQLANVVENELDRQMTADPSSGPDFELVGYKLRAHLRRVFLTDTPAVLEELHWTDYLVSTRRGDVAPIVSARPPWPPFTKCVLCGNSYIEDPSPGPPVSIGENEIAHAGCAADDLRARHIDT